MNLAALQNGFFDAVVGASGPDSELIPALRPPPRGEAGERLAIYRDGYRLRMREFLAHDYPALRALLGEADFDRLVEAFIARNPSHWRNARWVGTGLPRFLREDAAFVGRPLWADVAALEAALLENFDGPDFTSLALGDLAGVAPEKVGDLRFGFQPALALLTLRRAAERIFAAFRDGGEISAEDDGDIAPLLVWRNGLEVVYRLLEPAEGAALALALARTGAPFGEICAALDGGVETAAFFLARWFEDRLVVSASCD